MWLCSRVKFYMSSTCILFINYHCIHFLQSVCILYTYFWLATCTCTKYNSQSCTRQRIWMASKAAQRKGDTQTFWNKQEEQESRGDDQQWHRACSSVSNNMGNAVVITFQHCFPLCGPAARWSRVYLQIGMCNLQSVCTCVCTCIDYAIHSTACKHVHMVHMATGRAYCSTM